MHRIDKGFYKWLLHSGVYLIVPLAYKYDAWSEGVDCWTDIKPLSWSYSSYHKTENVDIPKHEVEHFWLALIRKQKQSWSCFFEVHAINFEEINIKSLQIPSGSFKLAPTPRLSSDQLSLLPCVQELKLANNRTIIIVGMPISGRFQSLYNSL